MQQRLKEIRLALELSQTQFAKKIDVDRAYICLVENGKRPLTERLIKYVCLRFGVNENWWRTGEGSMFIADSPPPPAPSSFVSELLEIVDEIPEEFHQQIIDIARGLARLSKIKQDGAEEKNNNS